MSHVYNTQTKLTFCQITNKHLLHLNIRLTASTYSSYCKNNHLDHVCRMFITRRLN